MVNLWLRVLPASVVRDTVFNARPDDESERG